jgi:antitoxin ParD1/3/4
MKRYAFTPLAEEDVSAIWAYVAADSIEAAGRVERAILQACVFLAKGPHRAHLRRDLTKANVRFWTLPRYPNYTLVCVPGTRPLRIIAVLHGKQNAARILRARL